MQTDGILFTILDIHVNIFYLSYIGLANYAAVMVSVSVRVRVKYFTGKTSNFPHGVDQWSSPDSRCQTASSIQDGGLGLHGKGAGGWGRETGAVV